MDSSGNTLGDDPAEFGSRNMATGDRGRDFGSRRCRIGQIRDRRLPYIAFANASVSTGASQSRPVDPKFAPRRRARCGDRPCRVINGCAGLPSTKGGSLNVFAEDTSRGVWSREAVEVDTKFAGHSSAGQQHERHGLHHSGSG